MSTSAARTAPTERAEGRDKPAPSGRLLLRMPRTLHGELARRAEQEGTSLNQFITNALATTVGWGAEERAAAASGEGSSRAILAALIANAIVIGLAAIAAIAVLLLAWLG